MARYRSEKQRSEAQTALAPVLKIMRKKLPRMAFPTTTKDPQFNVEALLDGSVSMRSPAGRQRN
jgi:hypothetical protein